MSAAQLAFDLREEVKLPPRAQETVAILALRQGLEARERKLGEAEVAIDKIEDVPQRRSWQGRTLEEWRKIIGVLRAEIAGIESQLSGYGVKVEVGR